MSAQNFIQTAFLDAEGRVRSGWRFAAFLVLFTVIATPLAVVSVAVMTALPAGYSAQSLEGFTMNFAVLLVATFAAAWICQRVFEDLPMRALGFGLSFKSFRNFIYGALAGALSIGLAAFAALAAGGMSFHWNHEAGSTAMALTLGTTFVIFFTAALWEESFFRGYPLQTFDRAGLGLFAVALTSVLFASMHNANPGASPLSWVNTLLAGLWLAACYYRTRDLWFPFGVHLTWNWFQGSVFGVSVSGLAHLAPAPLMRAEDHGPAWLTGGAYGLEGGLACTGALVVSTAVIWFLPRAKES